MIIGRTLSTMLSFGKAATEILVRREKVFEKEGIMYTKCEPEYIGNCRKFLMKSCSTLNRLVLPIQPMMYKTVDERLAVCENEQESGREFGIQCDGTKRKLSEAFEKRRKVVVGGNFNLPNASYRATYWGPVPIDYEIKRISENTITVKVDRDAWEVDYLVSSSKEELIKYSDLRFQPILYKNVIY